MNIKAKKNVTKQSDNNLIAICESKVTLKLNKPAYDGICILNFSKLLMYEFHHDCIKNKYCNKSRLLFHDTDGLMYKIKTKGVCDDFSEDKEMLDISNFSAKKKYYDYSNKLVVGKTTYERSDVCIEEFVGLKSRCIRFW